MGRWAGRKEGGWGLGRRGRERGKEERRDVCTWPRTVLDKLPLEVKLGVTTRLIRLF